MFQVFVTFEGGSLWGGGGGGGLILEGCLTKQWHLNVK